MRSLQSRSAASPRRRPALGAAGVAGGSAEAASAAAGAGAARTIVCLEGATRVAGSMLRPGEAVLLSDTATRSAGPLLETGGGTRVLTYTAGSLGGGPGPDPSDDAVHIRQRSLAASWIETTSAGGDGGAAPSSMWPTTVPTASPRSRCRTCSRSVSASCAGCGPGRCPKPSDRPCRRSRRKLAG